MSYCLAGEYRYKHIKYKFSSSFGLDDIPLVFVKLSALYSYPTAAAVLSPDGTVVFIYRISCGREGNLKELYVKRESEVVPYSSFDVEFYSQFAAEQIVFAGDDRCRG